jgi:hypothetical protein
VVRANAAGDRLISADSGSDSVTIFDAKRQRTLRSIGGFGKPRDLALED